MALAQSSFGGLSYSGKGLRQKDIQRFPIGNAPLKFSCFWFKLFVGERLKLGLQRVDLGHQRQDFFNLPLVFGPDDFLEDPREHNEKTKNFLYVIPAEAGIQMLSRAKLSKNQQKNRIVIFLLLEKIVKADNKNVKSTTQIIYN